MPDTNDTELKATAKDFVDVVIDKRNKGSGNKTAVGMRLPWEILRAIDKVRRANDLKRRDATRLFADELERILKKRLPGAPKIVVTSGIFSIHVRLQ